MSQLLFAASNSLSQIQKCFTAKEHSNIVESVFAHDQKLMESLWDSLI